MNKEKANSFIKHRSLTGLLRRQGVYNTKYLQSILDKCEVDSHVGELPPELRRLIPKEKISKLTKFFFDQIDKLLVEKCTDLLERKEETFLLEEISNVFGSTCIIETLDVSELNGVKTYKEWGGAVADVYKLSFPELSVSYALKVYKHGIKSHGHGPMFEIPTALCAFHSEPKYNNNVYMANLTGNQYMLSKWLGNNGRGPIIDKKNAIYRTGAEEVKPDNYCCGKRIDFGRTYKTYYGLSSYNARKYYRKMLRMSQNQKNAFSKTLKTQQEKSDYKMAQLIFSRSVLFNDFYRGHE